MPTRETAVQRALQRTRTLLHKVGDEYRTARLTIGLSSRDAGAAAGISHTQVLRIERGLAPHVDIGVLARLASVEGYELSMGIYPAGPPVRDKAHLALLTRLKARLHPSIRWHTEVPIPIPGDLRSADATAIARTFDATVEAETRLSDVQATVRKLRAKQRDLATTRAILLVADTRHNRAVLASIPDLDVEFPIGTHACLAALAKGRDPGGDCLVVL